MGDRRSMPGAACRAFRPEAELGDDWYVGGGCVAEVVWNVRTGRPPLNDVLDIEVAYSDPDELTAGAEYGTGAHVRAAFDRRLGSLDDRRSPCLVIKNQARVHEWYEEKFAVPLQPFESLKAAIST